MKLKAEKQAELDRMAPGETVHLHAAIAKRLGVETAVFVSQAKGFAKVECMGDTWEIAGGYVSKIAT